MPSKRGSEFLGYIAANVQRLREERGLTQQAVTDAADLDPRHYRRIERGTENLSIETLVKLADVLGVEPAALFRPGTPQKPSTGRPRRRAATSRRRSK